MINERRLQKQINEKYADKGSKMNSGLFVRDFSEGYAYSLGTKDARRSFITVEPDDSRVAEVLGLKRQHYSSFDFEQLVASVIRSILLYGNAYIIVHPQFETIAIENEEPQEVLQKIELREAKGIITKTTKEALTFWELGYSEKIVKRTLPLNCLIEFNIGESGCSKRKMFRIKKQLDRCDLLSWDVDWFNTRDFDFDKHKEKSILKELKVTNELGWSPTGESDYITDSFILFRRIKQNVFKKRMLDLVIGKINDCLLVHLNSGCDEKIDGKIVVKYRESDYCGIWEKYQKGEISTGELVKML